LATNPTLNAFKAGKKKKNCSKNSHTTGRDVTGRFVHPEPKHTELIARAEQIIQKLTQAL
jgi:hypothetical protein